MSFNVYINQIIEKIPGPQYGVWLYSGVILSYVVLSWGNSSPSSVNPRLYLNNIIQKNFSNLINLFSRQLGVCSDDKNLYVCGGHDTDLSSFMEKYDSETDEWMSIPKRMKIPRHSFAVVMSQIRFK